MSHQTTWPGTQADMGELLEAVLHNCTCTASGHSNAQGLCSAHTLLTGNQAAINRLMFGRRIADRLRQEEWSTRPHAGPSHS
jgi:hypothetical protein